MRRARVLPPAYLLVSLLTMLGLDVFLPGGRIIPLPWNLLGVLPLAAGIGLNLLADQSLHAAGTTVKPDETPSSLITTGVYRLSRHPMYLGFVAVLVGVALLLASLTPWLIVPMLMAVLDRVFIVGEERMMAATFGAAWEAYTRKVRRWF